MEGMMRNRQHAWLHGDLWRRTGVLLDSTWQQAQAVNLHTCTLGNIPTLHRGLAVAASLTGTDGSPGTSRVPWLGDQ